MEIHQMWGSLAVGLAFISYIPYLRSLGTRRTKPHAFSWLVWCISAAVAFSTQVAAGAGSGAWSMGLSVIACFVVTIYAFIHGEKNITRTDWMFLIAALATLPIWYFTADPLWAAILITLVDAFAFGPTIRKSWTKPHEEALTMYFMYIFVHICAILAMENYNLTTVITPAVMMLAYASFVTLCLWRRHELKKA